MFARQLSDFPPKRASGVLGWAMSCLLFAPASWSQDCPSLDGDVLKLLDAMAANSQRIEYSGVVTLQRGGDMQIMELSHSVSDGRATEQLARLTGQDALVERSGHPTNCVHPGHQLLKSGHLFAGSFCGLSSVYRFRVAPGERIAGRQAVRLRVEPLDMYRFGYVFELDQQTALMLKSSTLSSDQRVIEEFQFASLNMRAENMDVAQIQHQTGHPHPHETAHLRSGPRWELNWLPAGFMATDGAPDVSPRKTYTDGLASFSVFLEPLANAIRPGEGVERQGSTVAYTRGVSLGQRPVLVTVLGEIPTNTARMIADSVRLR